jgi:methionyl-tRNA formyltransferase
MSTEFNFGKISNVVFFGGGQQLLHSALHSIAVGYETTVVTSHRHSQEPIADANGKPLVDCLTENGVRYLLSTKVDEDTAVIDLITPHTLGVSMSAAWIFNKAFIDQFQGKLVNFHGSRLPQNRGGGGVSWNILRGERIGFSLVHVIDPGVDTGPILKYEEYMFPAYCRIPIEFQKYAAEKDFALFQEMTTQIQEGRSFEGMDQPSYLSTYWPRLSTDNHGFIDWAWQLNDIEAFICAFDDPYSGASTFIGDSRVRIKGCATSVNDGTFHPFQTGLIYRISNDKVFIATESGSLIVTSVMDEEGRDYLHSLRVGDRFHTSRDVLDQALQYRASYTPEGLRKSK